MYFGYVSSTMAGKLAGVSPSVVKKWWKLGLVDGFLLPQTGSNRRCQIRLESLHLLMKEHNMPLHAIERYMQNERREMPSPIPSSIQGQSRV